MKANYGLTIILIVALRGTTAIGDPPPAENSKDSSEKKFADLMRDDFFAGMNGDQAAFDRALKLCDDTLSKNPNNAAAMAWHGDCLVAMSAKAFQNNDFAKGQDLWNRGFKEIDDAVALEPDNTHVLLPRGSACLSLGKSVRDSKLAKTLTQTGVTDYEKVLQIQKQDFDQLSVHARGELLFELADGWFRLGDDQKSRKYLQRIANELDGSEYATRARDWLGTTDSTALQKKSKALSCIGCHSQ
jgi:tetratricopeptide (TPR) repeat protein